MENLCFAAFSQQLAHYRLLHNAKTFRSQCAGCDSRYAKWLLRQVWSHVACSHMQQGSVDSAVLPQWYQKCQGAVSLEPAQQVPVLIHAEV